MSTAYRPQSDGQTKVVNRCLEGFLICMTGEKPKERVHWLSLAEYWYNTNYHTSINTTPFEVLYGQPHLPNIAYVPGDSNVGVVDKSMSAREEAISLLNFHLERSRVRMKNMADNKRSERDSTEVDEDSVISDKPKAMLGRKKVKIGTQDAEYVLVQRVNGAREDATWELLTNMVSSYPQFSWDS
ncbi:retrotransposable element Tf2 [Tanacetum coccineum]